MEHDLNVANEALSILKKASVEAFIKKRKEIKAKVVRIVKELRKKAAEEKMKKEHKGEVCKAEDKEAFVVAESYREPKKCIILSVSTG